MPFVQIKIDQSGKPAGLPGVAREDLDLGTPVTLSAIGGPFKAYRWTIIDRGINFESNALSATVMLSPSNSSTQMTPIDLAGTYLVQVEIDSGQGLGATADDIARITFYAGPTLANSAIEMPQRIPAAREAAEHNVPNPAYPTGNPLGWAYAAGRWFYGIVRRLFRVGGRAGVRVSTASAGPTVTTVRSIYTNPAVAFDGTKYTVTLVPAFPDALYGVMVTPHESADYGHPAWYAVNIVSASQFEIAFYDNTDTPTGADFTAIAVLGGGT